MPKPLIDSSKCTSCGNCVDVCPVAVFEKKGKSVKVANPDDCIGCKACEAQCPQEAIKVED